MKAVMISIQPKWCELIASGKKTVAMVQKFVNDEWSTEEIEKAMYGEE